MKILKAVTGTAGKGLSHDNVSTVGGPQVELALQWFFINNVWWPYINGQMVSYYPGRLFGSGNLSRAAEAFKFGAEVTGDRSFGPMGSGIFSQEGYQRSAYIRNAHFMAMNGQLVDMILPDSQPSPPCYSYTKGNNYAWRSSFFYGGPGGSNC